MTLPLITASRLKDARACAKLDYLKYQLGYRAVGEDSEALTLGSLVHVGLEEWWRSFSLADAITTIRGETADPYAKARAEAMLTGYAVRHANDLAHYEVLAIEQEFRAPLRSPWSGAESRTFQLGGKLDAILRERATGRVLIMEHKTSSEDISAGSIYWRRLRMDSQVSIYFEGATAMGLDPEGCIYDVLGKPKQRPYQPGAKRHEPEAPEAFRDRLLEAIAAAPDAYYARGEVARLADDLKDAAADQWAIAGGLRDNARMNRHPRNPDACMRYGRACEFFPVCSGEAALDAGHYVRLDNPHPELTQTPKEEAPQCPSPQPV